jgi:thioredoxin 2
VVAKVDTDALQDLSGRLGIRSIPTLAVFDRGDLVSRTAGAMSAEQIEAFVRGAVADGD